MVANGQPEQGKHSVTIRQIHVVIGVICILVFGFMIFRIWATHRVKTKLDAIRTKDLPMSLVELDEWYPYPPPGQNAADVYADAFNTFFTGDTDKGATPTDQARIEKLPVVNNAKLPALSEPISPDMLDDIAWYIEKNAEAIGFLYEGATMTECRYPISMTEGPGMRLDHLSRIRQGARLLKLEAILAADQGDTKRAVQAVTSSLAAAHSLKEEPVFISRLVRIACDNISCGTLERVLSRISLSDEQLVQLASALANEEDIEAITRVMVSERCTGISHFRTPGTLTMIGGGSAGLWKGLDILYRTSGLRDVDLNAYLDIMNTYVEQAERPFPDRFTTDDKVEKSIGDLPGYCVLTRILTPALTRAYDEDGKATAMLRCAMLAVAIERYRLTHATLPQSLDDLVPECIEAIPLDPFDGKPLRFKKQEKGYIVYSIGINQVDDGGIVPDPKDASRNRQQPLDILFTVEK